MVSGMEKYFQIARCFRDEDLRADRQPEFTQLDMEMSFVKQADIMTLIEEMMGQIFLSTMGKNLDDTFPIITYQDAMSRYGSDSPDLRFGMELTSISDLVAESEFKVFASVIKNGGQIKGIKAPGCATYSRREVDALMDVTSTYGAKGLAWIAYGAEGIKSPIKKFLSEEEMAGIKERMDAKEGDLLLFVADSPAVVAASLGALRLEFGRRLGLMNQEELNFCWVVDFPLFEYDEESSRFVAIHHMFTAPKDEDMSLLESDPLAVRAKAYDLILNGIELGGGSIRIHEKDMQQKIFDLIGFSNEEAVEKFGFLLDAFEYGAPPHGGVAFGLDRMIMLMRNCDSIRDVIAFPKTQSASDLMVNAPGPVIDKQLQELFIKTTVPSK
jgi:aspartyl-tRNA synthetase